MICKAGRTVAAAEDRARNHTTNNNEVKLHHPKIVNVRP